jgi:hypothetical protein
MPIIFIILEVKRGRIYIIKNYKKEHRKIRCYRRTLQSKGIIN